MYYIRCITSGMVQPKTAPLSVRLGELRLIAIDRYAASHGIKRHLAVLELIDAGLVGRRAVAPTPPDTSGASVTAPGRPKVPYGSLLKKK